MLEPAFFYLRSKASIMFIQTTDKFGAFTRYIYRHIEAGHEMSLVPEWGGNLLQLKINGVNVLDGHLNSEALRTNDWGKSGLLFPFPNRLNDGRFTFAGQSYQFPINDETFNNALHGFGMSSRMKVTENNCFADRAMIKCVADYHGELDYYPFPFQLTTTFQITTHGELEIEMQMLNTGASVMPAGLGWHPYFSLGQSVDNLELQLPYCDRILINDRMIPTGERVPFDTFQQKSRIGETNLDTGFALQDHPGRAEVILSNENNQQLRYWQETGPQKFNYLQVFIPPGRQSIALEPMTCNIDAFNNGDGLVQLQPGEQFGGRFGFGLTSI